MIPTVHLLNGEAAKAAEAMDYPVTGKFAVYLWENLSSEMFAVPGATQLYRDCGYIPFSGYPLARSGKLGRMTRNEVEYELCNNTLCNLEINS